MKILYGITKSNFGGAQRYVLDLASEAKKAGHDVAVLCGGEGKLVTKLREENIKVITFPHLKRDIDLLDEFRSFYFILQTLREEAPDVFHTNSSKMGGTGNFAARIAGVPKIIFTGHGWAFNESWRPTWQKLIIEILHWFTIVFSHTTICVSEKTKEDVARLPFIKDKLVVIKNGIEKFELMDRAEAREKLVPGITSETLLVGSVSELHKVKGLDVLIKAWVEFNNDRKAHLVLIGGGEEERNLKNLSEELSVRDSITFTDHLVNARVYLSALDIFVMPSRSENLPYSLLEAGAASLPVIASAVGGIPEIITNEKTGLLVKPERSNEITEALIRLSRDRELCSRTSSALQEKVVKEFTINKMSRDTLSQYGKS